ncbi:MAG TPA: hypothetical protein VMB05_05015 [Solirubrobacteraceae bacterium]|nr:hypothetical protein [Solirubrobacteraceae bacterium]
MESAEYLVAVQLIKKGPRDRDRSAMYRAIDRTREEIDAAITSLERAGVLTTNPTVVRASPALLKLQQLDLIGV